MKTTVEVPDTLYRQIKAHTALQGQTIKAFFLDAVREKLGSSTQVPQEEFGWRAVFGQGDGKAIAEVQRIVDEEFSQIDYEEWGLPTPEDSP